MGVKNLTPIDGRPSRGKRKTTQFRVIPFYFITNSYKRFTKTKSTDPRQRVPLKLIHTFTLP